MQILSFPEAGTPPHLRRQVLALQREAWPPATPPREAGARAETGEPMLSHDPALRPVSMLLMDEDEDADADGAEVLAALDIVSKEIRHDGLHYRVGGLTTVVTRGTARGRGHGRRLVAAAREAMAEMDLDLGIFTCDRSLTPFYEGAGWQVLHGTVLVGGTPASPFPSDSPGFDKVTVACFFTARARRHRDSFLHARVGLFPGYVDKLW